MGFSLSFSCSTMGALLLSCLLLQASNSNAQLKPDFYSKTCPNVSNIIGNIIFDELHTDPRIAASLLRLHFHDCFVRGCDASLLLDSTSSFQTEKDAAPNANSARGFDVIDRMKAALETTCPRTVSCADILTIASQKSVLLSGGPSWSVKLGRRDSKKGFFDLANTALPSPFSTLRELKKAFRDVGLRRPTDLVALSGGHTFGRAQCQFVTPRLYNFNNTNSPDPSLNATYLVELRQLCPENGNGTVLVNFDVTTPNAFDSQYYTNLLNGKGLIQSDQVLFSTPRADTIRLVNLYSNKSVFFKAFVNAMVRMGDLKPLTKKQGEIRQNCRVVNSNIMAVDNNDGVVDM